MGSMSYRGFNVAPIATDPQSPLVQAWRDRDLAPGLFDLAGRTPVQQFHGITTDGRLRTGLYEWRSSGHSTAAIRDRAGALIALLSDEQKAEALRPIDSPDWMGWFNAAEMPYGARLRQMSGDQRQAVLDLVRHSLSARGSQQVWDAMRLNGVLGDIVGDTDLLNTWNYSIVLFGSPESGQPWGWQLQGHHVLVTIFVVDDQIVATPHFIGGEPVIVDEGPLAGLTILQEEERAGFDFLHALDTGQRDAAIVYASMLPQDLPPGRHVFADERMQSGACMDNAVIPYEGLAGADMTAAQRDQLAEMIDVYVSRLPPGHRQVRLSEVAEHLVETHFAWIGGTRPEDPFYYKIHSPVILIEFDQHAGVVLDNEVPEKFHSHTLVRTPNGNDYGKDLLRQHYERFHQGTQTGVPR